MLLAALSLILALSAGADASEQNRHRPATASSHVCEETGRWLDPQTREVLDIKAVLARAAANRVVLLGETHTSREDHLWQAHMLAGLYATHPRLVVGFEAFPRRVQPVLDRWSKGALGERDFLAATEWEEVWGYDADLYMPLFDFARQNRIPIMALNVDRELVSRVGRNGWDGVPANEREGVGTPVPASKAYRELLSKVYTSTAAHGAPNIASDPGETATGGETAEVRDDPKFSRFVDAQLTWDRAMAEALAEASRADPQALVVGILGRGHVEYGYGVPHQLADLGIEEVLSLLPITPGETCQLPIEGLADAVFVVDEVRTEEPAADRPKLGVLIEPSDEGGVLLRKIVEGSVAEVASLRAGDIVVNAAGAPLRTPGDLVEIIARQAPGTWLPLDIRRNGKSLTLVAKFPSFPDPHQ